MIVVKVGGSKGVNLDWFCRDIAGLVSSGQEVVIVHGGSHETNVLATQLGRPPRFVQSVSGIESRYTDVEDLEIFKMVYVGKINKYLVERLQQCGVNAVGLSGIDGRLLEGPRKSAIKVKENGKVKVLRGDYTGKVEKVNVGLIRCLLGLGFVPVICPPAISYEGEAINVDGDRAAAAIAVALGAEKLIILTNVPGLLRDVNDERSVVQRIKKEEMDEFLELAKGRMKLKLLGAIEALRDGVGVVVLGDGRVERPVSCALEGVGTVIC